MKLLGFGVDSIPDTRIKTIEVGATFKKKPPTDCKTMAAATINRLLRIARVAIMNALLVRGT